MSYMLQRKSHPTAITLAGPPSRPLPGIVLALWVALFSQSGCAPTEGKDTAFHPLTTTNQDFLAPEFTPVGNNPIALAYTSLSGVLDKVAVSIFLENRITVLQNTSGTLTEIASLNTLAYPAKLVMADLDGSGMASPDIAVLNGKALAISVYLNAGAGWDQAITLTLTDPAAEFQAAQVVGSALPDLVVAQPGKHQVTLFRNEGAGVFTPMELNSDPGAADPNTVVTTPSRIVVRDFNADGIPDLALLLLSTNQVGVLQGNSLTPDTFSVPANTPYPVGVLPKQVLSGNLNGDALVNDLAVFNATDMTFTPLWDAWNAIPGGPIAFTPGTPSSTTAIPGMALLAELDKSTPASALEIALVREGDNFVTVFRNDGAGNFTPVHIKVNSGPFDVIVGDWNVDSNLDLAVAERGTRSISLLAGDGAGNFTSTVLGLESLPTYPTRVDANGDGKDDLLLLQPLNDSLVLFLHVP